MTPSLPDRPVVSVIMVTYNHERYIRQAIESVLAQQTTFRIELVIGEDCSRDGTRAIVEALARERPDVIHAVLHPQNVGMNRNAREILARARGKFIAILEGDDFWSYPFKLQRQVEWLTAHPDSVMCYHDVNIIQGDSPVPIRRFCEPKPSPSLSTLQLIQQNPIPTGSILYRRDLLPDFPEYIHQLPMQDWPTWVALSLRGSIDYLDEVWGAYRLHSGGVWHAASKERQLRGTLAIFTALARYLGPRYRQEIGQARKHAILALVHFLVGAGRWRESRPLVWDYLFSSPHRFQLPASHRGVFLRVLLGRPSQPMLQPQTE